MISHEFKYGTSHASGFDAVFYGDNVVESCSYFV